MIGDTAIVTKETGVEYVPGQCARRAIQKQAKNN
jgi:hypothetical protein